MRRAIVLETLSSEVLKVAFRRERPGPGVSRNGWGDGGLSFPSGHTATAFAIGTVLAESGDDRHRWLRRVMGYGLGIGTAYQRINHDAHWLSDTVAGAALGIVTARFVLQRREQPEPRGAVAFVPTPWGTSLTYTVPLR
jgi:membrane-associated phospholipid phosphatase